MTKALFRRTTAMLLALMLLAACANGDDDTPNNNANSSNNNGDATTAADNSHSAGGQVENLVIGTIAENNTFSAVKQTDIFGRMNYNAFTLANFVYRDENNELQPYFFRSFEISEDGTKIDFTVPVDAIWHDGEPVTSDDILFTFDFMRDTLKVGSLQNLAEVNQLGDDAYEMVFSEPDAYYWINSSVSNNACLFAKHIWENIEDPSTYTGEDAAIGAGPFKLVRKDQSAQTSYYEAVHENDYAGPITVESVTLQTYSGEDTLMMAMMNGEVDAMFNYANPIDSTIIETVRDENIDLGESTYSGHYQMTYGMERAPGNDKAFREAVRGALNYDLLGITINGEYGIAPGAGIIPPQNKGHLEGLPTLSQDLDAANQILDDAGYLDVDGDGWREFPDGTKMEVLVTPQFSAASQNLLNRIGDVVMSSLEKISVKTVLDEESLANSEIWEANISDGKYDLAIGYTTSGVASYTTAFRYFLADAREGESTWIWGTFHNDEYRDTFFAMQSAASEAVYLENLERLQQMAADEIFAQALTWETAFFPYRTDKYTGWTNYPSWGVINTRTWHELTTK
ncbi:MAG: ABC transporter substrate-binding protein [Acidimicrobiia bacterium]